MFKFIKKATSALLASMMCIPTGIVNVTHAVESNPDGNYTVTLTDTENGLIQFSESSMNNSSASQDGYQMMQIGDDGEMEEIDNDGSLWAFNSGDNVEIECIPDDGYYVETLSLKDSETGKALSQTDTANNVFSFSMPEKNVSVEAVFSSTATINIEDDEKSKSSDDSIEYHDITEDMEISKDEVEEVVADVITEGYIKSNLDEKYATVGDKISLANILVVKNSIFDGAYVEEDDTIDSIMSSIENGDKDIEKNAKKFVSQLDSCVIVYDLGKENDYYVAYANTMIKDTAYIVQDYAIAVNNNNGELVEGCIYDEETGLLYIPKDLYMGEEGKDIFLYLQIQFMQVFNKISRSDDESMTSELHTISVDEDKEQVELSSYSQEIFSLQTSINVEKGMDAENLNVVVNGFPMKKDAYTYNPETGELVVAVSPASVNSIEVTENESALSDELLDFMEKSEAVTLNSGAGMPAKKKITVDSMDDIPTEGWGGVIPVRLQYHHTRGDNPNLENVWIAWTGGNNDVDTTAFINALINNTDISFSNLVGRDNPFDILFDSYADSLEFSAFLKQIGTVGANCAHVSTPIPDFNVDNSSGSNGVTDLAPGEGKIYIKVIDRQDNKPEKGKATGYIVLGMFTRKSGDQIGNAVIRIDYEAEVKDAVDPIYLYMFKKSVEDVPKIGSATLNGAEYEMLFYSKQHFGSAENAVKKGSQTARFDTNRIWHSS